MPSPSTISLTDTPQHILTVTAEILLPARLFGRIDGIILSAGSTRGQISHEGQSIMALNADVFFKPPPSNFVLLCKIIHEMDGSILFRGMGSMQQGWDLLNVKQTINTGSVKYNQSKSNFSEFQLLTWASMKTTVF
jgi:hypothetical protein